MYIKDGIVYAPNPEMEQRVSKAQYLPYGMLLLTFDSGEERLFDVTTLTGPTYAPLEAEEVRQTVQVFHGAVTWLGGEIDCAPEYMYAHSYAYNREELVG